MLNSIYHNLFNFCIEAQFPDKSALLLFLHVFLFNWSSTWDYASIGARHPRLRDRRTHSLLSNPFYCGHDAARLADTNRPGAKLSPHDPHLKKKTYTISTEHIDHLLKPPEKIIAK